MLKFKLFNIEVSGSDIEHLTFEEVKKMLEEDPNKWRLPTEKEVIALSQLHRMGIGGFNHNLEYFYDAPPIDKRLHTFTLTGGVVTKFNGKIKKKVEKSEGPTFLKLGFNKPCLVRLVRDI